MALSTTLIDRWRRRSGGTGTGGSAVLLLETGSDKLLIEGTTDAIVLEGDAA